MAEESRGKLALYLIRNAFLVVLVFYIAYRLAFPPGKPQRMEMYLGDAFTGCMYPVNKLDLKKIMSYSDETRHTHWDELTSMKQGFEIGYQICKEGEQ